ncbi:uncharacterized protein LOC9641421 [Selaginella moellendorffii]|uniref:uncharacterized protein LOC9641421 n=1 Tax=Selaginella moellendorffii TaxID=88036 RepID=UPI000D1C7F03|nr:uncharacterized protein LOC9641421 [Selaginella moellendorffii]|eukprot:XP_024533813.1 uncharacterized protein LOC9641421 [Selaginella moellendorffii]
MGGFLGFMAAMEQAMADGAFARKGAQVPVALKEAVGETLEMRRVITAFRRDCLHFREGGLLYEIVKSWYDKRYAAERCTDYPESLERRTPYAAFKGEHPELAEWYGELDFLLREIPVGNFATTLLNLPLDSGDASRALEPDGILSRIISPCPFLTHGENVALALLDARLWLCRSALPLAIGQETSYWDASGGGGGVVLPKRPTLPSTFYVLLQESAVQVHATLLRHSSNRVYELAPSDFTDDKRECFWARMARVRFPHVDNRGMSSREFAATLARSSAGEDRDLEYLECWREDETRDMYRLLAMFIHDRTPEMHEEQMEKLAKEEEEEEEEEEEVGR